MRRTSVGSTVAQLGPPRTPPPHIARSQPPPHAERGGRRPMPETIALWTTRCVKVKAAADDIGKCQVTSTKLA